jgi:SagB-type dehydrogenase family enzyme
MEQTRRQCACLDARRGSETMRGDNRKRNATSTFHNATKYTLIRDEADKEQGVMGSPPDPEASAYYEHWDPDQSPRPYPYKIYETLVPTVLPRDAPPASLPALEALACPTAVPRGQDVPDRSAVARIALLSNGLLNRQRTTKSGGVIDFRAAGCTGELYHLEFYFVCGDLRDLPAGLYHYAAHDHSLRLLRAGDFRSAVVEATGGESAVLRAPVILAVTSTFWRNAWKYCGRAYRHTFWDAGTVLAHVLAATASVDLPTRIILGYADEPVNALLGVDGVREAAIALCAIGDAGTDVPMAPPLPPLAYPTRGDSSQEVTFSVIPMMHAASSLASGAEAATWRSAPLRRSLPEPTGKLIPLEPLPRAQLPPATVEELVARRRSTRLYDAMTPIPYVAFSTLLERSAHGFAADCLDPASPPLHDNYLIVNGVEGLALGAYFHHPHLQAVELLNEGDFRRQAQRLATEQEYAGEAHVNSYYLTDLSPVLEQYGNRGYRAAQLECAICAGRLQLGTHALGLRMVGSTALDDEVIAFFSPHAAGKSYMFLTVFGKHRPTSA